MNLIELERLVRQIGEVLQGRGSEAQARGLAQEYAQACNDAQRRLEQCVAMLAAGQDAQALQLAEAPPPLMDLLTRLGFRQTEQWRDYCKSHGLAIPDAIDARFIGQLSAAYGKGLSSSDELYTRYREAVLGRKDEEALAVLRAILRANPADSNAPRELERLEQKILQAELRKMDEALANGDEARCVALLHEIEACNLAIRPEGEIWKRGQTVRCSHLLKKAQAEKGTGDWMGALQTLSLLNALRQEHELSLESGTLAQLQELEEWVLRCQREDDHEHKHQHSLTELRRLIDRAEGRIAAGENLDRADLREIIQQLDHQWGELRLFDRPIEQDLARRVQKALQVFGGQAETKRRAARRVMAAALALLVIAALGFSLAHWRKREAGELAGQLRELRTRREVAVVERLVARIQAEHAGLVAKPALEQELRNSAAFLQTEQGKSRDAETLWRRIEEEAQKGFLGADPEAMTARVKTAQESTAAAALDFQAPLQARAKPILEKWEKRLDALRTERTREFSQRLDNAALAAETKLHYGAGPEGVRSALQELHPQLARLDQLANPPLPALQVPTEGRVRLKSVLAKAAGFSNEVARWDEIHGRWDRPSSLTNYLESLALLQRSDFAPPADKAAAGDLLGMNLNSSALFRGLLLPEDPEGWARFERGDPVSLKPDEVMPGERSLFNKLRDDENILNVTHCKIIRLRGGPASAAKSYGGFVRGVLAKNKFGRKNGVVYDPEEFPQTLTFRQREFDDYAFSVEEGPRTMEAEIFERVGMKSLIDSRTGTNYAGSLLSILDALNHETEGNALFKAYLALRLHEMIDLRPHSWDAHWTPALAKDRQELRQLGAEQIVSGDWFLPFRHGASTMRFREHFDRARAVSYRRQAGFLSTLARRARETGFVFAGHADASGKPVVRSAPSDNDELWGWTASARAPALLFRTGRGSATRTLAEAAAFSPLFRFPVNRKQLLAEVRRSITTTPAELGDYLPPLFAPPYE